MAENTIINDLTLRHEKVAFMAIKGADDAVTIRRMVGFTSMSNSRNPTEYTRKYVDEKNERTDITAINTSMGFAFDKFTGNDVHEYLAGIFDNELIGADAVVDIYVVDFTKPTATGENVTTFECAHRPFTVVPSSDGDDANTYTYSGDFRSNGDRVKGVATVVDDGLTITFVKAV